jgi:hypothetical protein
MPSTISLCTDTGTIVDETNGYVIQCSPEAMSFKVDVAVVVGGQDIHGILDITPGGKANLVLIDNDAAERPLAIARGLTADWMKRLGIVQKPVIVGAAASDALGYEKGTILPTSTSEPSSAPVPAHEAEIADLLSTDTSPAGVTGFDFTDFASTIPTINQAGFDAYDADIHYNFALAMFAVAEMVETLAAAATQDLKVDAPVLTVGGVAGVAPDVGVDWSYSTEARAYYITLSQRLYAARAKYVLYGGYDKNPGFGGTFLENLRKEIMELEDERRFYNILIQNLCTDGRHR